MGNMMAYKITLFMVFFNVCARISNYIGKYMFPDTSTLLKYNDLSYLNSSLNVFNYITVSGEVSSGIDKILTLAVSGGLLALFAFSLLIPTIPLMALLFSYNGILTIMYLDTFNLPSEFAYPLKIGVVIVSFIGISQYMARSTVQGA